jgi:multicomponent K+:H+ antiporter subunit C
VELLVSSIIGLFVACGIYLLLRARTFPVVLGLILLAYGVNLLLVSMGRLTVGAPPLVEPGAGVYADPLPQALVLTAIVIGFGTVSFAIALAVAASRVLDSDHVDGAEPPA